jgi:hypothetical protein
MQHLIDLPDRVLKLQISKYLTLNDIVILDSACLNHVYRPFLLSKIQGMVLEGKNKIMSEALHKWVRKRKIHLQCLILDITKGGMFYRALLGKNDNFKYESLESFNFRGSGILKERIEMITPINIILYILSKSINLRHLLIQDCQIERFCNNIADFASCCFQLESFKLLKSSYLTGESITSIATNCSKLRILHIDTLNTDVKLKDSGIISISTHCKDLEELSVVGSDVTDESIISIATHCTGLLLLNVGFCLLLTDASLLSIATHCPRLQELDFCGCEHLTDISLISISINCTSLEILRISHTKFGNNGLYSIATHCKKLRLLNVLHSSVWNYLNNPWTNESLKSLEELNVSYTNVTDHDIRVVAENCLRLKSLNADNCLKTTCVSFLVIIYKLYFDPIEPVLENLCIMGHFGIDKPEINYLKVFLNQPCSNYLPEDWLEDDDPNDEDF